LPGRLLLADGGYWSGGPIDELQAAGTPLLAVIAHAKVGRRFTRFHLRGLQGAKLEWSLACTAHNLARLATHHRTA
jgi:hypothetical protein